MIYLVRFHIGSGKTRNGATVQAQTIDRVQQTLLREISRTWGGATSYTGTGAWVNDESKLVRERVMIIESYVEVSNNVPPRPDERTFVEVKSYATALAREAAHLLEQESVLVTYQTVCTMEFIKEVDNGREAEAVRTAE